VIAVEPHTGGTVIVDVSADNVLEGEDELDVVF